MAYTKALRALVNQDPQINEIFVGVGQMIYAADRLAEPEIGARVKSLLQSAGAATA